MTLIVGGARSGKSRYAERLARVWTDEPVYLATSRVYDSEHQARIERHRRDRGSEWTTIEEPLHISKPAIEGRVVVVDCVTLWLNNCFSEAEHDVDRTLALARAEVDGVIARPATWIFVSNELGQGPHAMTEIGRRFVDLQGWVNQYIAARADTVVAMVSGIPVLVKGELPPDAPASSLGTHAEEPEEG